jgi:hypothetical protein
MFGTNIEVPVLRDYEHALQHYNSIVPIRGSDDLRPICKTANGRRRKHQVIRLNTTGGISSVQCVLYATACVTFLSNGEVHVTDGGYQTRSTFAFVGGILGAARMFLHQDRTWLSLSNGDYALPVLTNVLRLRPYVTLGDHCTQHKFEVLNPVPMRKVVLDRKAFNQIKKRYAPFRTYVRHMEKVFDGRNKDYDWASVIKQLQAPSFLQGEEQRPEWAECMPYMILRARDLKQTTQEVFLDWLKQVHAKEVFVDTIQPEGELVTDRNRHYLSQQ